jgi:MoaA/NifB/PqqE/SkfB family radical SAM enzyme
MGPGLPFPKRINVELTNYCNQRCPLCPRQQFTRPLGFMPRELFERIALECARHDTLLWLHFLGEPLLHRHAVPMVRLAKEAGCRVGLSTNGTSLATHADALLDSGLDRLECSLDALDRTGYEAMRGRDHFDRVTQNVRDFLIRKRARGRDAPITSIQFMRTPAAEAALQQIVDTWQPYLGPRDFVMTIEPASFGGAVPAVRRYAHSREHDARPACRWLFEALVVLQDGTVTMCGADWDARAPLGNVRTATLEEIWTGAEADRRRTAHLRGRFDAVGPCATCDDWRLADGHGYVNVLEELRRRVPAADKRRAKSARTG